MNPVVLILGALGWLAAAALLFRLKSVQEEGTGTVTTSHDSEAKLEGLRKELSASKEAVERKAKVVEELKAEAKKKARREGKKEKPDDAPVKAAEPTDKEAREEIARLKKAILGLEAQIEITVKKADATARDAEKIANETAGAQIDTERQKAKDAIDARKQVERTLEDLRTSIKKKAESRPDVPGSGLDLKSLSTEVVQELSRYYRKAEHYERLQSVAQGQLQLAQDRFNEQQKRYFAVCRELAVAAGRTPDSDLDARKMAEDATSKTNAAVKTPAPAKTSAPATQTADSADVGEDGEKKKRRRRRRKKKGDGSVDAAGEHGADNDSGDSDSSDDSGSEAAGSEAAGSEAAGSEAAGSEAAASAPKTEEKPADAKTEAGAKTEAASDDGGTVALTSESTEDKPASAEV